MSERPVVKPSIWRGVLWAFVLAIPLYGFVIWLGVTLWNTFASLH